MGWFLLLLITRNSTYTLILSITLLWTFCDYTVLKQLSFIDFRKMAAMKVAKTSFNLSSKWKLRKLNFRMIPRTEKEMQSSMSGSKAIVHYLLSSEIQDSHQNETLRQYFGVETSISVFETLVDYKNRLYGCKTPPPPHPPPYVPTGLIYQPILIW